MGFEVTGFLVAGCEVEGGLVVLAGIVKFKKKVCFSFFNL